MIDAARPLLSCHLLSPTNRSPPSASISENQCSPESPRLPLSLSLSLSATPPKLVAPYPKKPLSVTMNSMPRHFFIQTVGCQMNILDSKLLAGELRRAGHEQVDAIGRADVIPLNTCGVRRHAEDKIYSLPGRANHDLRTKGTTWIPIRRRAP